MRTVGELLRDATARLATAGSDSARLDAELLLAHAIGVDRTTIVAHPDTAVGDGSAATFEAALARREQGEPVAYIRGLVEFHGLAFAVDPRALIPRPETELLVDLAVAEIAHRLTSSPRPPGSPPLRIADVGTGTGAIAISIAAELRRRRMADEALIVATDAVEEALDLARENAVSHGVADRIVFLSADLLPPVVEPPYAVLCANLPYVRRDAIEDLPVAVSFEPRTALDGGADGLEVVARLLGRLPDALAPDGVAFVEIGADQADAVMNAAAGALPDWSCDIAPDLAGRPRIARLARTAA